MENRDTRGEAKKKLCTLTITRVAFIIMIHEGTYNVEGCEGRIGTCIKQQRGMGGPEDPEAPQLVLALELGQSGIVTGLRGLCGTRSLCAYPVNSEVLAEFEEEYCTGFLKGEGFLC